MSSTLQTHAYTQQSDDEISLLDLLIVVAENFWLLLTGTVLVAVLGFVVSGWVQPTFVSQAAVTGEHSVLVGGKVVPLFTPAEVVQLATSSVTLNGAARTLDLKGYTAEANALRAQAAGGPGLVKATIARNSTVINLEVITSSGQTAQAVLQAVVDSLLVQSRPQGEDLGKLQDALKRDAATLERSRAIEANLSQRMSATGGSGLEAASAYANVVAAITALSSSVKEQEARLKGLPPESVLAPPSLPQQPAKPKRALISMLSGLVAGFVLLLWVFVRQSWRNAQADPGTSEKIQRIRRALLGRRSIA